MTSGPAAGQSIEVDRDIVVGRENADFTIADPELSRRHVALRPVDDGIEIEDLGSLNGTFVDGERISGPVTLSTSGRIKLGLSEAEVEVQLAPPQEAAGHQTRVGGLPEPDVTVVRKAPPPQPAAPQPPPAEASADRPDAEPAPPDVTAVRPASEPGPTEVAPPGDEIPSPDVTRVRPIPAPDVTAVRQRPESGPPDATAVGPTQPQRTENRPTPGPPPVAPGPASPQGPDEPREDAPGRPPLRRMLLPVVVVVAVAGIALLVISLLGGGGGGGKKHDLQGTVTATVASQEGGTTRLTGSWTGQPGSDGTVTIKQVTKGSENQNPLPLRVTIVLRLGDGTIRASANATQTPVAAGGFTFEAKNAKITGGTGTYDGATGSFGYTGTQEAGSQTALFTLNGSVNF